jgi:hypothetical protein
LRECDGVGQNLDKTAAVGIVDAKRRFEIVVKRAMNAVDFIERRLRHFGCADKRIVMISSGVSGPSSWGTERR